MQENKSRKIILSVAAISIVAFLFWYLQPTTSDDVVSSAEETLDATSAFINDQLSFNQKNTFVDEAEKKLQDLKDSASNLKDDVSEDVDAEIKRLESLISEAKNSTEDSWEDTKQKITNAYQDLKTKIKGKG